MCYCMLSVLIILQHYGHDKDYPGNSVLLAFAKVCVCNITQVHIPIQNQSKFI